MANYDSVEMDLDSDNSHSSRSSGPTEPSPVPAKHRDVSRKHTSPPRHHRSPPRRGVNRYRREPVRSPERHRGERRRDQRDRDRPRHYRDRRSHRSRERRQRPSRRRSRSGERRRRHSSSSPEVPPAPVTSTCSRVPAQPSSVSTAVSLSTVSTTSNIPRPDVSRVLERVERLRRQGCVAAYQQIVGGMQNPLPAPVTPALPQHPQIADIPKFYNPAAINIAKIADQERKKKLLWGSKSGKTGGEDQSSTAWKPVAAFEADADGKVAAKFLRLMGAKNVDAAGNALSGSSEKLSETVRQQQRMFDDMEHQYEQARMSTHTQRGFGLGYTAQYYQPKF